MGRCACLVIGPAGSGKSTFCDLMRTHCENLHRRVHVVNLDPAAEHFSTGGEGAPGSSSHVLRGLGWAEGATPLVAAGSGTMTLVVSDTSGFHFRGTAKASGAQYVRTYSMLNAMRCEATPSLCSAQTDHSPDYLPRRSPFFCLVHPAKCSSAGGGARLAGGPTPAMLEAFCG